MTLERRETLASGSGWRKARLALAATAIGLGGWQAGQIDWAGLGGAVNQALWSQALQKSPAVASLQEAAPVWRAREGASGDKILERVHRARAAQSRVAVIDEISGHTIPSQTLAEQAATYGPDDASHVEPARFDGVTEGDRLTISTTDGQVYTFDIVSPKDHDGIGDVGVTIRVDTVGREGAPVLYAIPVEPREPESGLAQQEL